jgi:sugar diacid utilization regulator
MTPEKIVENHKKYVLQSWSKQGNLNPIPVAKADGIYFYDFDSNRYTDMSSQLVNLNLGYGNKAIGDAIIGVKADMADHISSRKLESAFERTIYSYKKHWGGFKVDNMMFYVLNDFSDDEIESIAEKIQSEKERYISVNKLYVVVSKTNNKLKSLPKTYQIVLRMLRLAVRTDMMPMFYDRLEVKKLILAVDDISLLESIYNENLKKLEVYDRDNGTDYMSFLRLYLKYDGSVQRVAQETFVHRNTINYQLAKIKKILGNSLKTFEERFKIILAFEVRDVL